MPRETTPIIAPAQPPILPASFSSTPIFFKPLITPEIPIKPLVKTETPEVKTSPKEPTPSAAASILETKAPID
jgi:hypothetical protein